LNYNSMNPSIYFIFYIVILVLSYRIRLSWSLACSISISAVILIFQISRISYETILFILFFNSIPLVTEKFKKNFKNIGFFFNLDEQYNQNKEVLNLIKEKKGLEKHYSRLLIGWKN